MSPKTRAGEIVNKPTSVETSTVTKDAVPDKTIKGQSRKTRRKERIRKRKQVTATSNQVQNLTTMSMTGNTIPRYSQYYESPGSNAWLPPPASAARNFVNSPALNQSTYGRPGLNVWLPPPAAAARNCLVYSPAINQSSYGRPGLNVWLPPPAAAARNCLVYSPAINQSSYGRPGLNAWLPPPSAAAINSLEISPAVNQSSYQTGFHFDHYNANDSEATHVPPNPFRPCGLRPHEIFHQETQIPGTPQNRIQLPNQNFTPQIRTHTPRSTFDSRMGISQQPELPHHASNIQISALLPHQKRQHQLPSHRTWMTPPSWKPYS
ncbi:uncharacterized protein [Henckelia pumila]|uniref:uncharacterized protein n=1 Tax=Henckelia pumila TaxID=405737 RepID=UPI003C6E5258